MKFTRNFLPLALSSLFMAGQASAVSLLFDFGTGGGALSADQRTNSPGHATGAVPSTEVSWNTVGSADIAAGPTSGLTYGDGTAATNIALNLAVETAIGSNILDYAATNNINSGSLTGSAVNLGAVYGSATSSTPAKDGIFRGGTTSNSDNAAVGFRLDGLAAGTYTLYFTGRNTNSDSVRPVGFYTAVGASSDTFNFLDLSLTTLANSSISNNGGNPTFVAGNNYNSTTFTIAEGQSLFFAAEGTTSTERRGFINSVEIALVPEPSAIVLSLGGVMLALRRRR
ncbi:PEP-CTERM sorting domain-containing protein [Luteolibacter sp. SL250]|uniref:PEP-CTERM sorting domain-containing protein n=1 Tax=Luteolibacter sp. SL250 TaxID=2995170 RepID=UPI00226DF0C1|nr:PEP-CTERM sorting domain-containing protein [Luteolibacter sp. SL250]WAC19089.1 PEP-CTERM sorting domain-containing protein [Luteolibacter sp. SL250]